MQKLLGIGRFCTGKASSHPPLNGEVELARIIEELPVEPFLAGETGVLMSLTGAQEKLPIALLPDG